MKCNLEIFFVSFYKNSIIRYSKIVVDITYDIRNPDEIVQEIITKSAQYMPCIVCNKYISHSTSWRYEEDGSIYLTYIVFSDDANFSNLFSNTLQIHEMEIPKPTSAKKPRPKKILEKHIVSHGIRHIAYLINNPGLKIYRDLLNKETVAFFKKIEGDFAGKI